jgi:UDP-GlcNAc:undecaprenyl-phosphate GlcNAc-1-phosphate transferase
MDGFIATIWPYSISAFTLSFLAAGLFIYFRTHGFSAKADKRRHHTREVSLLGGIAILIGLIPSAGLLFWNQESISGPLHIGFVLLALGVAVAVGLADDRFELRARWKFLGHNLIAGMLWFALRDFETPVDRLLGMNSLASSAIEWFWCIGTLNSINLIDGLDGLASGVGLLILCFLCLTNSGNPQLAMALLWTTAPAILGFFLWNRNPARIFLGEAGALSLGILLFVASMTYNTGHAPAVDLVAPLFAHGLPIFDTLMAMGRRVARGTGLMAADREHIHHRLLRLGFSHRNSVRFLHALTVYLCLIGYQLTQERKFQFTSLSLVTLGIGINLVLLMMAERRLYSYLTNFASQILKLVDENRKDGLSMQVRMRILHEQGTPFVVFALNLENCVKNLLEKSPGKTQVFYQKLTESLHNPDREIYFENSTSAVLLQILRPGDEFENMHALLLADLIRFENEHKLDLYLNLRNTLRHLPVDMLMPSAENVAAAKTQKQSSKKQSA